MQKLNWSPKRKLSIFSFFVTEKDYTEKIFIGMVKN